MRPNIFKFLFNAFMLTVALFACREQDEMFRKYVTEGGIVYPCKALDAKAFPGIGRVELSWLNPTRTVTSARIWWNGGSATVDISADMDTVHHSIPLPEGIYSFTIRTFDKDGNRSVPVVIVGSSIGEKYLSKFLVSPIKGYKTKGGGHLAIEWDDIDLDKGPLYNEVIYTAVDGSEKTIQAMASDTVTVIDDYNLDAGFRYTTFYQPDPKDPLIVNPAYREIKGALVAVDKTIGKVAAFSDEWPDASTRATGAYDGKTSKSRWHSLNNGYPHWIIIDLGAEVNIVRLDIWPSDYDGYIDDRMPDLIRWEVSAASSMPEGNDMSLYNSHLRSARQLNGASCGMKFNVNREFASVSIVCPSWNTTTASLTLSVYEWKGSYASSVIETPVASKRFERYADNSTLTVSGDTEFAAGDYLWIVDSGLNSAGVFTGAASPGTEAFWNGVSMNESYESYVSYNSWTNLGEFDYDRSTSNWAVRPYDEFTPTLSRYVKLTGISDPGNTNGIMCLGEIDAYTIMGE